AAAAMATSAEIVKPRINGHSISVARRLGPTDLPPQQAHDQHDEEDDRDEADDPGEHHAGAHPAHHAAVTHSLSGNGRPRGMSIPYRRRSRSPSPLEMLRQREL